MSQLCPMSGVACVCLNSWKQSPSCPLPSGVLALVVPVAAGVLALAETVFDEIPEPSRKAARVKVAALFVAHDGRVRDLPDSAHFQFQQLRFFHCPRYTAVSSSTLSVRFPALLLGFFNKPSCVNAVLRRVSVPADRGSPSKAQNLSLPHACRYAYLHSYDVGGHGGRMHYGGKLLELVCR